jgi:hypothetical protein
MQELKKINISLIFLNSKELIFLTKVVLDLDFPKQNYILKDVMKILKVSKPTAIKIMTGLVEKGFFSEIKSFVKIYNPTNFDRSIILKRVGLI